MINGLPERLRSMREKQALSQRAVAHMLDVSPSLISGYETGERTPSVEILLQLSNLLHCSCDYLLGKRMDQSSTTLSLDGMTARQVQIILTLADEFQPHKE